MKIVVLTWWTGWEREVALKSCLFFEKNLEKFDKYILPDQIDDFLANYKKYDLAIPLFHWEYWEDWVVFGLLEAIWLKYTFSDFSVHSLCMNKKNSSLVAKNCWLNVPKEKIFNINDEIEIWYLTFPMIVKPNSGWSSLATNKVNNIEELRKAVKEVFDVTSDIALIQEFVVWTEYSVPIVWNWDDLEVLPIMKVELFEWLEFFDFDAKYNWKSKEIFWEVEPILNNLLTEMWKTIYKEIWCSWISRVDFIVTPEWKPYFLEVNTIPWMTSASIFPQAWRKLWRTDKEFINKIISLSN